MKVGDENEEELKMILLGESGVGKTAIIKRYLYDHFDEERTPSTTMNYVEKKITLNNRNIRLNIWDTIGQEKYRSLSKLFLNDTQIVILVYSIDDSNSFEQLEYWNKLYKEQLGNNILLGLVGNKVDLIFNVQVTEDKGKEYAKNNNAIFAQLSAKENRVGIIDYIERLVKEYYEMRKNKISIEDFEIIEMRNRGLYLSRQKMKDYGYNEEGCCGGKAKVRRKKYDDIIKNNNGVIDSIFLGDNSVGKTSLIKRIIGEDFDENENHTEDLKKYETDYTNATMQLTLNIYDINNKEKKNKITESKIIKSKIYFLVYDLNNIQTLKEIDFMLKVINNCKTKDKNKNDMVIVILGNKKDLKQDDNKIIEDIENSTEANEGRRLANENNADYFITSAKDNNDNDLKDIIGIAIEKYLNLP